MPLVGVCCSYMVSTYKGKYKGIGKNAEDSNNDGARIEGKTHEKVTGRNLITLEEVEEI